MKLGVLKDIKVGENRVIVTPLETETIVASGHEVLVQSDCGKASGFPDEAYEKAGARVVATAEEVYGECDIVVKVKEIEESEAEFLREGQIILTCLHPAANPSEVDILLEKKVIAFTAEDSHRFGSPNCEAAGKQGALFGLESMLTINGGKGVYVGGLAGAPNMRVLILGAGLVGRGALSVLHALGAFVTIMDIDVGALRTVKEQYGNKVETLFCTKESVRQLLPTTDMIINGVKWPRHSKEFLIDREMLSLMEPGSVLVDIADDNPGAIETSHGTTHDDPRYVVDGIIHYCVGNIPSSIARSTSIAYAAEMLPHLLSLLNDGVTEACVKDGYLRRSLTCYHGVLTHEETSAVQGCPWRRPEKVLGIVNRELDPAPPASVSRSVNYV